MKKYLVYVLCDPRKPGEYKYGYYSFSYEPFYVGMGTRRRERNHTEPSYLKKDGNKFKTRKIVNILATELPLHIVKIKEGMELTEAKDIEKELISTIGRFDKKCGPLTNLTDGADGPFELSHETREKIKKGVQKRWSKETEREKLSKSLIGNSRRLRTKTSEVGRSNMSVSRKLYFKKMREENALRECGHSDWLKCTFCQKHDRPEVMYIRPNGTQAMHRSCRNENLKNWRHKQADMAHKKAVQ